jgi:hypothetical protein
VAWILINACGSFMLVFGLNVVRISRYPFRELSLGTAMCPACWWLGVLQSYLSGVARPVGGWVCYRLVSELLVETSGRYGSDLFVRVSWLRSNFDLEVENLKRNGIAEFT